MMSASRRIVVDTFRVGARGRPRRTGVTASLAAHSGADRSGASSGSTQTGAIEPLFRFIRFPHGNDPAAAVSRRPYDDDHPAVQQAKREEAVLALPVRGNGQ